MPSTYSPDLRIELIANGEKSGTWGAITNDNLGVVIEDAIAGLASVTVIATNQALTALNGAADQSRCAAISLTNTTGANFNVYVPPVTKLYVIKNEGPFTATVYSGTAINPPGNTTPAGTGVAIPAGKSVLLRCTGSPGLNIVEQLNHITNDLSLGGTLTVTGAVTAAGFTGPLTGNVVGAVTGNVTGNVAGSVAVGAGTVSTTNFTFVEVGGVLYLKNGTTNILKIESTGAVTALSNLTAYGTV
jgi:hypothetical protein